MKLNQILEYWEKDAIIDITNISSESVNIPVLHNKYYRIYVAEKVSLDNLNLSLKELELEKWNFYNKNGKPEDYQDYKGNFFDLKLLKNEKERFIEVDPDLLEMKKKIILQKEKVETLREILKMINNRSFQLKNFIDYEKFKAGGY